MRQNRVHLMPPMSNFYARICVKATPSSNTDEVVTRKEIVDNCWNRTFVTDQVVTQSIFELRKYLRGGRPKAEAADYIRTVPKRGYQLVASVAVLLSLRRQTVWNRPLRRHRQK